MPITTDTLSRQEAPERVHYATGVMLGAEDFQAEQDYHRGRLARALAYGAGHGTLAGLAVAYQPGQAATDTRPALAEALKVAPGLAIDRIGRLIEVPATHCLNLPDWYAAQLPLALAEAWHAADDLWEGSPAGVVLDLFLRFVTCPRGKTPAFAHDAFDSFDSITAARLRDSFEISAVLRPEQTPGLPEDPWEAVTPGDAGSLREAIFAAWREDSEAHGGEALSPGAEHVPGQDPSALLLARVILPADPAPPGQPPVRRSGEPVTPRNDLRRFVVTTAALARWLEIPLTTRINEETTP